VASSLPLPVAGVRLGTAGAAIKESGRDDVLVIDVTERAACSVVFTRNLFCAAPVIVARRHLGARRPRLLLCNSGNANAGTGVEGVNDALATCRALSRLAGCPAEAVLPFSTGVIGERLPLSAVLEAIPLAYARRSEAGWEAAARAIMTTDTRPKVHSARVPISGVGVTVTGIAKGAGMIHPNMATMLAFIATDAYIAPPALDRCLREAVERTFNRITVDGDTSTNDACVLIASGHVPLPGGGAEIPAELTEAVRSTCAALAEAIVRDGEGATKYISVEIEGGRTEAECLIIARAVAGSPLVKTACHACDPNWGRILAAVGRSAPEDLQIGAVSIHINGVPVVACGKRADSYTEAQGRLAMAPPDIALRIGLARGHARAVVSTCDLSAEYVRINAEYRS
jgi:glutamate N-acetyltransferase/amino-acid N-acetyltransferase